MKNSIENIENYLKGKLSPTEKAIFEEQLKTDTLLAQEMALKRLELESYELLVENSLKGNMAAWKKKRKADIDKPFLLTVVQSTSFKWAAAATFALIAFFVYKNNKPIVPQTPILVGKDTTTIPAVTIPPTSIDTVSKTEIAKQESLKNKANPTQQVPKNSKTLPPQYSEPFDKGYNRDESLALVEEYAYEPDFDIGKVRKNSSAIDSALRAAKDFISAKQFNEAQKTLVGMAEDNRAKLLLGYSYLKLRNYNLAISSLKPLAENDNFNLKDNAQWYLALAYIGANKKSEGIFILNNIKNSEGHTFEKSAADLLVKLKK